MATRTATGPRGVVGLKDGRGPGGEAGGDGLPPRPAGCEQEKGRNRGRDSGYGTQGEDAVISNQGSRAV